MSDREESLMNLESFGHRLMEVVAQRALEALRTTKIDDVRRVMHGQFPLAPEGAGPSFGAIGTAVGAFAVGAALGVGLTALYTPTSGPELRKSVSRRMASARKQGAAHLDEATSAIARSVEQLGATGSTSALAAASPSPRRKATSNGHAVRSKSVPPRHDA
jgi:hypothetical protein